MNSAYTDSSIILQSLLGEGDGVEKLKIYSKLVTSDITDIECRRVLDRVRIEEGLSDKEVALRYGELEKISEAFYIIPISQNILARAREPFPTIVRTLDAIHLATALLYKRVEGQGFSFITLDQQQSFAAQALGFKT